MKQILWLKTLIWGFIAGVLAGLAMLLTMTLLRLADTNGTDLRSDFSATYRRVLHWLARPRWWLHAAQAPGSFRRVNRASDCRRIGRGTVCVLSKTP